MFNWITRNQLRLGLFSDFWATLYIVHTVRIYDFLVKSGSSQVCSLYGGQPLTPESGFLSSVTTLESGVGLASCPWLIDASPGQRINITLYSFAWHGGHGGHSGHRGQERLEGHGGHGASVRPSGRDYEGDLCRQRGWTIVIREYNATVKHACYFENSAVFLIFAVQSVFVLLKSWCRVISVESVSVCFVFTLRWIVRSMLVLAFREYFTRSSRQKYTRPTLSLVYWYRLCSDSVQNIVKSHVNWMMMMMMMIKIQDPCTVVYVVLGGGTGVQRCTNIADIIGAGKTTTRYLHITGSKHTTLRHTSWRRRPSDVTQWPNCQPSYTHACTLSG